MEGYEAKRTAENSEAWILGSGTASLASAVYLIEHVKVQPRNVHILDKHASLEQGSHDKGDPSKGYDQFAGCLPVPGGLPLKDLLATVPSAQSQGRSVLDEIQTAEAKRLSTTGNGRTRFLAQKNGSMEEIPIEKLNLGFRSRVTLVRFLLKREKSLAKGQIRDFFPRSFFDSVFWAVWSAQCVFRSLHNIVLLIRLTSIRFGFQPWHSAVEFRRAIRRYLPEFHSLSILNGLDITGYYQYETLYLPMYFFLQSRGVDIQFGTGVKNIDIGQNSKNQQTINGLHLIHDDVESHRSLGDSDIVLVNVGSTISGSAIGTNDIPPVWQSMNADDALDENWSAWLDLGNKHRDFGDPYNFCTRESESMLESFTITTEDLGFFDNLRAASRCTSEAGAFIFLKDSHWKMNLCIPSQPVFPQQPQNVRVLWGLAHSPELEGNYVNKPMLHCPGTDIMDELLAHLPLHYQAPLSRTITIPRAMPRMSAMLLTRDPNDRPRVIPRAFSNVGLVGHFTEIPEHTCVDVSYGILTAQMAVFGLMGSQTHVEPLISMVSLLHKVMFWR